MCFDRGDGNKKLFRDCGIIHSLEHQFHDLPFPRRYSIFREEPIAGNDNGAGRRGPAPRAAGLGNLTEPIPDYQGGVRAIQKRKKTDRENGIQEDIGHDEGEKNRADDCDSPSSAASARICRDGGLQRQESQRDTERKRDNRGRVPGLTDTVQDGGCPVGDCGEQGEEAIQEGSRDGDRPFLSAVFPQLEKIGEKKQETEEKASHRMASIRQSGHERSGRQRKVSTDICVDESIQDEQGEGEKEQEHVPGKLLLGFSPPREDESQSRQSGGKAEEKVDDKQMTHGSSVCIRTPARKSLRLLCHARYFCFNLFSML